MKVAVILLAAGASSRLGEPKALARIGGIPVLGRMLAALDAGAGKLTTRPLVITGAHHGQILSFVAGLEAPPEIVHHSDWALGRTTSVQAAARLRPGQDLLLWPVDVPLVSAPVLRAMLDEWASLGEPGHGWLAPSVDPIAASGDAESAPGTTARFGHPVLLGAGLASQVLDLEPTTPLRRLRMAADPLCAIKVADRAILDDLDTPGDLARLRSRVD